MDAATFTSLEDARENTPREWDWLIDLNVDDRASAALQAGGTCGELLVDMRLLGMAPAMALAAERKTIDSRPS